MYINNKRGMSLIEVIVAICILGLITVPFVNFFLTGSIFTSIARHDVAAVNTAQEIMEEIKTVPSSHLGIVQEIFDDTIVLESNDNLQTDNLEGYLVALTGGPDAGQVFRIIDYNNDQAAVELVWKTNTLKDDEDEQDEQNPQDETTYLVMRDTGSKFPFEIAVEGYTDIEDTEEFDDLKKITVTVFYQDRGRWREISLTTDKSRGELSDNR